MLATIVTIVITLFILGAILGVAVFFIEKIPATNPLFTWGKVLLYLLLAIVIISALFSLLPVRI